MIHLPRCPRVAPGILIANRAIWGPVCLVLGKNAKLQLQCKSNETAPELMLMDNAHATSTVEPPVLPTTSTTEPAVLSTTSTVPQRLDGQASAHFQLIARRTGIVLRPNNSRVVIRPFDPSSEHQVERILGRVASLSEAEVDLLLEDVMREFRDRHQKTRQFFLKRFHQIRCYLLTDQPLSENRKLLMGAYFTQEYALESAALFNPSMVWHPDQSGLPAGWRRFILSLRATGEGHISSITFRTGVIDDRNHIHIDEPTRFVTAPELVPNTLYDKQLFARKLVELGIESPFVDQVLETLAAQFTRDEIQRTISRALHQSRPRHRELEPIAQNIFTLVR